MSDTRSLSVENGCLVIPVELIDGYSAGFDCTAVGFAKVSFRTTVNVHEQLCEACEQRNHRPRPMREAE